MNAIKGFVKHAKNTHWASKTIIKVGVILATLLLVVGLFIDNIDYSLAIDTCSTAVSMFSIAIIAGLLVDVIAKRKGIED